MVYIKSAIMTVCFLLVGLLGYIYFTFDTHYETRMALEAFQKGDNSAAVSILDKIDVEDSSPAIHLYKAYIYRQENQLEQSNKELHLAAEKSSQSNELLAEIALNLTLNAYLTRDMKTFDESLRKAKHILGENNQWVELFSTLELVEEEKYGEAAPFWKEKHENNPLSQWMKKSFGQIFTPVWFTVQAARSEIEGGKYLQARQSLEQEIKNAQGNDLNEINFLIGLSYIKEAQEKPITASTPYFKLAFSYFNKIPIQEARYAKERDNLLKIILQQIDVLADKKMYYDLGFYTSVLENWHAQKEQQALTTRLSNMLEGEIKAGNWKSLKDLITLLNRLITNEQIRSQLSERFTTLAEQALANDDTTAVSKYWDAAYLFSPHPEKLSQQFSHKVSQHIFEAFNANVSSKQATALIDFWKSFNKESSQQAAFADKLVNMSEGYWEKNGQEKKGLQLMVLAQNLAPDKAFIHAKIEKVMVKVHEQALAKDNLDKFPAIFEAIKELKLTGITVLDKKELAHKLEEAQYMYTNHQYQEADKVAKLVLIVEPDNQKALRLAGMSEYLLGYYTDALSHLSKATSFDEEMALPIAVSQLLGGDAFQGNALLEKIAKRHPIERDTYLRLGYGSLLARNPEAAVKWFERVTPADNMVYLGLEYAAYQKGDWQEITENYNKLTPPYHNLEGAIAVAIQGLIQQGKYKEAEEKLEEIANATQANDLNKTPLYFQTFNSEILTRWNRDFIAAIFYKDVKKDPAKALQALDKIKDPSFEVILEKADVLLALGKWKESKKMLRDLYNKASDNNLDANLLPRLLPHLAKTYSELGEYTTASKYLEKYFDRFPEDLLFRDLYAHILIENHRYDQAYEQFKIIQKKRKLTPEEELTYLKVLLHRDQFDDANKLSELIIKQSPSLLQRIELARLLVPHNPVLLEKFKKDLSPFEKRNFNENLALLRMFTENADYPNALELSKKMKSELEKTPIGLMALAELYLRLSYQDKSIEYARKAEQLAPLDGNIAKFISKYETKLDAMKPTIDAFDQELVAGDRSTTMQLAYGRLLMDQAVRFYQAGQVERISHLPDLHKANAVAEKVVTENTDLPEALFLYGQTLYFLDKPTEAMDAYIKALKIDKSYTDVYKHMAVLYEQQKAYVSALEVLERSLHFTPNDPEAWDVYARVSEKEGNSIDAINALKEAIRLKPNVLRLYIQLAKLNLSSKNPEEARKALEVAIKIDPKNPELYALLLLTLYDRNLQSDSTKQEELTAMQQSAYKKLEELDPKKAKEVMEDLQKMMAPPSSKK